MHAVFILIRLRLLYVEYNKLFNMHGPVEYIKLILSKAIYIVRSKNIVKNVIKLKNCIAVILFLVD